MYTHNVVLTALIILVMYLCAHNDVLKSAAADMHDIYEYALKQCLVTIICN